MDGWLFAALFLFAASAAGARGFIAYAHRKRILDVPNERSSHTRPTPRGGGVAIVVPVLAFVLVAALSGRVSPGLTLQLLLGGGAVALLGWVDDRRSLPDTTRVAVWIPVSIGTALAVGGLPTLRVGASEIALGWLGIPLVAIGIFWMINLYNFMDGIDGLAGGQAVVAATAGALVFGWRGESELALVCTALDSASAGFLVWNWSPAKLFMGDVGSGFLGYCFALIALHGEASASPGLGIAGWAVILAPFLVDATFTVIRRALRRERLFQAHCTHAYQRAIASGRSHRAVTTTMLALSATLAILWIVVPARWSGALIVSAMLALLAPWWWLAIARPIRRPA